MVDLEQQGAVGLDDQRARRRGWPGRHWPVTVGWGCGRRAPGQVAEGVGWLSGLTLGDSVGVGVGVGVGVVVGRSASRSAPARAG